jgi:cell wall-associated NlpC family hydrolase
MTSVLRSRAGRVVSVLSVLGVLLGTAALVPTASYADPNLTIAQAQQRVNALYDEASAATERYHTAQYKVDQTRQDLSRVRKQLSAQRDQVATLDQQMSDYAAALYSTGGLDPTLQIMLAEDPASFLSQAGALDQVARTQDAAFRDAQTARLQLAQTQAVVDDKLASLQQLQAQAAKEKQTVDAKLADAQQVLSSLKAAQRARLAALEAQRAQAAADSSRNQLASVPAPSPSTTASAGPVSGRAGTAVAFARAQVGKPYVFGAAGPSAFDCSGLTMAAWGQAGVYLAHSASVQYGQTSRVSQSDIQPGDLVFFYGGLEHVGIYVGGGLFVHAANPSEGVRVDSLFSSYWQSVLVGIGRV